MTNGYVFVVFVHISYADIPLWCHKTKCIMGKKVAT